MSSHFQSNGYDFLRYEFMNRGHCFSNKLSFSKTRFFVISQDKPDHNFDNIVSDVFLINDVQNGSIFKTKLIMLQGLFFEIDFFALTDNYQILFWYFGFFDDQSPQLG